MNVIIHPKKLAGEVVIPPSKSLSHRAIIAACLADGQSVIDNVILSKDIIATIEACRAFGARIEINGNRLIINGSDIRRENSLINANESGSTIRFMIPILLVNPEPMTFIGENNLVNRPLNTYYELFDEIGIKYEHPSDKYLPLKTVGGLKPYEYRLRGDISSQFITGLLYALPLLPGNSKIIITTNLESKGYIDLTLDILYKFGIKIINNDYKEFIVKGNQSYMPYNYYVEGDYSQTAFYLVADALGSNVVLKGVNQNSYQGDKKIIADVKAMNGEIVFNGDKLVCKPSLTKGAIIDFSQSPDLGPALTVLAALSTGKSEFINAGRLRIKECDRITCMKEELNKMGAKVTELEDGMIIEGVDSFRGATLDSHNDHRIAMALAVASTRASGDVKILNAQCVSKSYPHFWEDFKSLGGEIEYE